MRGRPLVELLVFAAAWLLLLIPLRRVTGGRAPVAEEVSGTAADVSRREQAWVRVTFSEAPVRFTVQAGEETAWVETAPRSEMETLLALPSAGGLLLEAHWPEARRRAVELAVEPVDGAAWRRVLWTDARRLRENVGPE